MLFVLGTEDFDPAHYRPHPPGYPLLIGLSKAATPVFGSPFRGLVGLSVLASLVGFLALVDAFASHAGSGQARRAAITGALFFALSPSALVYGPMALSESPALAFVALALAAAARLGRRRTTLTATLCGASAAAAIGCRPQLALAIAPLLLLVVLLTRPGDPAGSRARFAGRLALAIAAGFAVVSAAWLVPLVVASGGPGALLDLLSGQAGLVAENDASLMRDGASMTHILRRFVVDPWGPAWAGTGLLGLATLGTAVLLRRRRGVDGPPAHRAATAPPLLAFSAVDLGFALAVMNPVDAARYALPSMLGVAFLAGVGCAALARRAGRGGIATALAAALLVAFAHYTWPLLRQRASVEAPAVQAAGWARDHLQENAVVLYDREVEAHTLALLGGWKRFPAEGRIPCTSRRPVFLFADGASEAPQGVTFRWLEDGEAWRRLTRRRLGVVSFTPIASAGLYEAVSGVYGMEPSARVALGAAGRAEGAPDSWRWLSDRATIRVCPAGAEALDLRFRLPPAAPHDAVTVTVEVAGAPATSLRLGRGETHELRAALPVSGASERNVRVDLRTDRWFRPAEAGIRSGDRRRLSVQLLGSELVPGPLAPRPPQIIR